MTKRLISAFILVILSCSVPAKTKRFGTWIDAELTKKITKKIDFSLTPEVRLQDDFRVDEYMAEGRLSYEPLKFLSLAAGYRINNNLKNSGNEWTSRFTIDAQTGKGIGRWNPSFRLRFTNYSDFDETTDEKINYLRYRIKVDYDIKNSKINPFIGYELFHNLNDKTINKSRFDLGFNWNFLKRNRISLYYRLQDYFTVKNSIHILGIGYQLKL
jgi:hypothetical protein